MSAILAALDAAWFARCRALAIVPPLDERGQLTDDTWLGEATEPAASAERAA